jgi:arabinose-5-phosphate isomerase
VVLKKNNTFALNLNLQIIFVPKNQSSLNISKLEKRAEIIAAAQKTIELEAEAIQNLNNYIDEDFIQSVNKIYQSKGRVIVAGIGKSANIANKIVATLNSTGTPAIFMHAADAIHGDLGIIQEDDVVICISKSGNTPEIKVLIPLIKNFGNIVIGMVSNTDSFLAQQSDYVLTTTVSQEACPNNLAPTTSTTAQLVMGDALAMALLDLKGFSREDFAKVHPGGALGKQLYMRVEDLTYVENRPMVRMDAGIREIILEISSKRLGATVVLDEKDEVRGIITDGDLRRMLQNHEKVDHLVAKDIMSENPRQIDKGEMAISAFHLMESNSITSVVVNDGEKYIGIIHLHDILKEGIV